MDGAAQTFLFRCPVTGFTVQGLDHFPEEKDRYIAHACPDCGNAHLVNPRTGKLMSEEHPFPKAKPEEDSRA